MAHDVTIRFVCFLCLPVLIGGFILAVVSLRKLAKAAVIEEPAILQLQRRLTEACAEKVALAETALYHQRRGDEFFKVIETIEGERERVWKLYRESSAMNGNAQTWLFEELHRVLGIARALRVEVVEKTGKAIPEIRIAPVLATVMQDYHGLISTELPTPTDGQAAIAALDAARGAPPSLPIPAGS